MKNVNVCVDFTKIVGKMKPMHGVGQPPRVGNSDTMYHYLTEAGIPYARLHAVGGWLGGGFYVDVPNLFRDFNADENDPNSYDFAFTDKLIAGLMKAGCEPYFRLGVTIENDHLVKSYRIFPPKDYAKWARICEHIIRHYKEGWANGYTYDITYWEIWNEPDDCYNNETAAMWKGTPEQYFELYSVTAKHLKSCFGDAIKVGGYGHCGLYEYAKDKDLNGLDEERYIYDFVINFMHGFFKYQQKTGAPIDFFSWHVYDRHPETRGDFTAIANHAQYVRRILDKYGYTATEHHLNEWNLWTKAKRRDEPIAAAKSLAFMLMMQNTSTDVMCFYDAGLGYSDYRGLFSADSGYPYRNYYAFAAFNGLYRLGSQVAAVSDDRQVFVGAAVNGRKASIALSNVSEEDAVVEFSLQGFPTGETQVFRIDEDARFTLTGETLQCGKLKLPANSCMEIKLWDIGE